MKQVFYSSFNRDIKKIRDVRIAQSVKDIILLTSGIDDIAHLPDIKKLKGHKTAYRIRIETYRIGVFIENNTIYFSAFDHRKDIYKRFP